MEIVVGAYLLYLHIPVPVNTRDECTGRECKFAVGTAVAITLYDPFASQMGDIACFM